MIPEAAPLVPIVLSRFPGRCASCAAARNSPIVRPPDPDLASQRQRLPQAGVAAGLASVARMMGNSPGVAVVGSVLDSRIGGRSLHDGFTDAARPGLWIMAGCGLLTVVLALATNSARAGATAERTRLLLEQEDAAPTAGHASGSAS